MLAEPVAKCRGQMRIVGCARVTDESDPVHLPRLLRFGGERRGEKHRTRASEERPTVDH
jgi:hypothetical protein